jgi:hypothetical protein
MILFTEAAKRCYSGQNARYAEKQCSTGRYESSSKFSDLGSDKNYEYLLSVNLILIDKFLALVVFQVFDFITIQKFNHLNISSMSQDFTCQKFVCEGGKCKFFMHKRVVVYSRVGANDQPDVATKTCECHAKNL